LGFLAGFEGDFQDEDMRLLMPEWQGHNSENAEPIDTDTDLLMFVHIPHLGSLRYSVWLRQADAYLALTEGDPDRLCRNLESISGTANHAAEVRHPFCGSKALSFRAMIYTVINDVLADSPDLLADKHLDQLNEVLDTGSDLRLMRLEEKLYEGLDLIQRIYADDGKGGGRLSPDLVRVMSMDDPFYSSDGVFSRYLTSMYLFDQGSHLFPDRETFTHWVEAGYNQVLDDINTPKWQQSQSDPVIEWDDLSRYEEPYQGLIYSFIPVAGWERWSVDQNDAIRESLLAGIALERYRRVQGGWPASLEELVPQYLSDVPADPFTGQPVGYAVGDGGPVIYSVGVDRDDDGGRPPQDQSINPLMGQPDMMSVRRWLPLEEGYVDGDWVLYPERPTLREQGPGIQLEMLPIVDFGQTDPYGGPLRLGEDTDAAP